METIKRPIIIIENTLVPFLFINLNIISPFQFLVNILFHILAHMLVHISAHILVHILSRIFI